MNSNNRNGNGRTARNGNGNGNGKKKNGNGNRNGGAGRNGTRQLQRIVPRSNANVPVSFNAENRRAMNNRVVALKGSDFLSTVEVKSDISVAGDRILAVLPVTPSGYPGTRVTQLSQLYERYRIKKFNFRYVPAVPVTLACQLLFYTDLDPLDDPSVILDADQLIRQATAQTGSQQWNFHTPKVISMARRADNQLYYTGEDKQNLRFSQQGTGYLIQVTSLVNIDGEVPTTDLVAGSLYVDWEIEFQTPQINPEAVLLSPFADQAEVRSYDVSAFVSTDIQIFQPVILQDLIPRSFYAVTLAGERNTALPTGYKFMLVGPGDSDKPSNQVPQTHLGPLLTNLNGNPQIGIANNTPTTPAVSALVLQADLNGDLTLGMIKTEAAASGAFDWLITTPLFARGNRPVTPFSLGSVSRSRSARLAGGKQVHTFLPTCSARVENSR